MSSLLDNLSDDDKAALANWVDKDPMHDLLNQAQDKVLKGPQPLGLPSQFPDTGRQADSPGEQVDSVLGAPVRMALHEAFKPGTNSTPEDLWQSIKNIGGQIGKDPKSAPTGFDIASKDLGIENPYLGTAVATAGDVAQVPITALAGTNKAIPNSGRIEEISNLAKEYASEKGLNPFTPPEHIQNIVNTPRAKLVAEAYESMKHDPNNPEVAQAYKALVNETMDQFQKVKDSGVKISKITPDMENPYKSSKDLFQDLKDNKHMWYYPTESGFGNTEAAGHPLLAKTSAELNGEKLPANDVFRIVHDFFGHGAEEYPFGPKGEEAAYQAHSQLYSPEAQKALASETRGQNSWVNYGPKGEANRANPANTTFAEQKAGILPEWARSTANTQDTSPELQSALQKLQKSSLAGESVGHQTGVDKRSWLELQKQIKRMQDLKALKGE